MFREALNKSDSVVAQCLAHKKYLLKYHLYEASIFFDRALPHLELELIQSGALPCAPRFDRYFHPIREWIRVRRQVSCELPRERKFGLGQLARIGRVA